MFYFRENYDIANYEDNTTPYCRGKSTEFVAINLEKPSTILLEWFNNNYVKLYTCKSHLLLSVNLIATAKIGNSYIESEDEHALLGITTHSKLTFENYINSTYKKANQILNVLERIALYMNIQKRRTFLKSFITSHFSYCSLI